MNKGYELVNFCEVDKYAGTSYCAIHNVDESLNLGDITQVDETKVTPFNMICGGSPCQDFSWAGKQAGSKWRCQDCGKEYNPLTVHYSVRNQCPNCCSENLDKTRSSLLVEWLRMVRANKPKWGIYENVKNIVGKQFKSTFQMLLDELHEYGYNTYYQVFNAKDFGVPQNRERVYLIMILKELDNGQFKFPIGFESAICLKDLLEDEVDEKYYVNTPKAKQLIEELIQSGKLDKTVSNTVRAWGQRKHRRTSKGYDSCIITGLFSKQCSKLDKEIDVANSLLARDYKGFGKRGMNGVIEYEQGVLYLPMDITQADNDTQNKNVAFSDASCRIRKLTPKECWRLMGFSDTDFENAKQALNDRFYQGKDKSNSQLYKQAGNSIVTDVLYYIFKELYCAMPYLFDDLKVSSFFSGIGAFEIALDKLFSDISKH